MIAYTHHITLILWPLKLRPYDGIQIYNNNNIFTIQRMTMHSILPHYNAALAALKFCFKTCVAMKFMNDDDDDDDIK